MVKEYATARKQRYLSTVRVFIIESLSYAEVRVSGVFRGYPSIRDDFFASPHVSIRSFKGALKQYFKYR